MAGAGGKGTKGDELRRLAEECGVADRVEWAGAVSDVRPYLAKATVFAYS